MYRLISIAVGLCTTALSLSVYNPAVAQVTADGTAGTIVDDFGFYSITGGTQELTTLFHSFTAFSPDAASVYFELDGSQNDVDLVLGRVTGNNPSFINGELGVFGGNEPDLFLINPNGIAFGADVFLDIPGSLMVSTADSMIFADGQSFSSRNLSAPPQLTISTPIGLQFGTTATPITLEDSFLELSEGKSFGFFGGDVQLSGVFMAVPRGTVSIGSVAPGSQITLLDDTLVADYTDVTDFQGIRIDQDSNIDLSGDNGGQLLLQGGLVSLVEGTVLRAETYGAGQGGDLTITADVLTTDDALLTTDSFGEGRGGNLIIEGGTVNLTNETWLTADSVGVGQGGNLTITADRLTADKALLATATFEEGQGGNLTIEGSTVNLTNETQLIVDNYGVGRGGNLFIQGDTINLANDVQLTADAVGTGQGGNVTLIADVLTANNALLATATFEEGRGGNLTLQGETINLTNDTLLIADTFGIGQGGNLLIQGSIVNLTNDAQLTADAVGAGQGGNVTIVANVLTADNAVLATATFEEGRGGNLTLEGETIILTNETRLIADTFGIGQSGSVTIQGRNIDLSETSQIGTVTFGGGDGGELRVTATESINIRGHMVSGETIFFSGLFASAESGSTGDAGNVYITTPSLSIRDGGTVSVNTFGPGDAGSIVIRAGQIEVADPFVSSDATISGVVALVLAEASGQGGSIDIEADQLQVFDGGQIAASTRGRGDAGTINIRADEISVSGESELLPSAIAASSFTAATAGSVSLAGDEITIQNGAEVSVNSNGGAGDLNLSADTLYLNNGDLSGNVGAGTGGNLSLAASDVLLLRNGSLISTNATDSATGGNILLSASAIVGIENSDITANAIFGSGGNIDITADVLIGLRFREQLTPLNDITASSQFGFNGSVDINNFNADPAASLIELPENLVDVNNQIVQHCDAQTSSFSVTGRSGIPTTPGQGLGLQNLWHDTRPLSAETNATTSSSTAVVPPLEPNNLVEASAWRVTAVGQIELTAASAAYQNLQAHSVCSSSS